MRLGGLAAGCLLLAGCATAHPDFEQRFETAAVTGRPHDAWMALLDVRYGCDTVIVKANAPSWPPRVGLRDLTRGVPRLTLQSGIGACDLASLITPEVVRAWYTPPGLREEWSYRSDKGQLATVFLEGPSQRELRVKSTAR